MYVCMSVTLLIRQDQGVAGPGLIARARAEGPGRSVSVRSPLVIIMIIREILMNDFNLFVWFGLRKPEILEGG